MNPNAWEQYEQVAVHLLNQFADEFGLDHVEGKQTLPGRSGTTWDIDGNGVRVDPEEAIIVVECRRYLNSRQTQEKVAGLAFRFDRHRLSRRHRRKPAWPPGGSQ
jgi:hypothetical protein